MTTPEDLQTIHALHACTNELRGQITDLQQALGAAHHVQDRTRYALCDLAHEHEELRHQVAVRDDLIHELFGKIELDAIPEQVKEDLAGIGISRADLGLRQKYVVTGRMLVTGTTVVEAFDDNHALDLARNGGEGAWGDVNFGDLEFHGNDSANNWDVREYPVEGS